MRLLHFLRIRIKLFIRTLHLAGWGLLLFAFVLCLGLIIAFLTKVADTPDADWGVWLCLPIVMWHFNRGDIRFLQHIHLPVRPVLWMEYSLGNIPAAVFLGCTGNWKGVVVLAICTVLTPLLPVSTQNSKSNLPKMGLFWLPPWAFEWKSGIRRMTWLGVVFWWAALCGAWWIGTLPLFAFLYGLSIMPFYEAVEPKEILQQTFSQPNGFWRKMGQQLLIANGLLLPHMLVFWVFNRQYWYFLLAILFFISMVTAFSVASKYAVWHPRRRRVEQSILSGLFIFATISAIFTPVALGWVGWKSWQADRNMRNWFG